MTMPYERRGAILNTRQFLVDILSNPASSEALRDEAYRCLKHYPDDYHMDEARKAAPEVFGNWEDMSHD